MQFDDPADLSRVCTERLGEKAGRQFAAMARRGFQLVRPAGSVQATGQCRLGGPALLEPEICWPERPGRPSAPACRGHRTRMGLGDAGTLYFTIPVKALATGDFSQAVAQALCC
ncbi:hypothetical protein SY2F82_07270 [Streptomyces sp. Y2F8-2]|nr:hypothetical protein SY2F82_07270 [Streptomyces sp. Y2F8-2]